MREKQFPFSVEQLERLRRVYLASQSANGARAMLARAQAEQWLALGREDLAEGATEEACNIELADDYERDLLALIDWALAQHKPKRKLRAVGP